MTISLSGVIVFASSIAPYTAWDDSSANISDGNLRCHLPGIMPSSSARARKPFRASASVAGMNFALCVAFQ